MTSRITIVETTLNRMEFRWKCLRFLQHSFLLASVLCALVLLLGGAILLHWVPSRTFATVCYVAGGLVGLLTWFILFLIVFAKPADRAWLAAAIENVDRRLLDRLNTLVFLQRRPGQPHAQLFARRIASQTQQVLAGKPARSPFSKARLLAHLVALVVLLAGTVLLYHHYSPWSRLRDAEIARNQLRPPAQDRSLELPPPATNNLEQNLAWGEVRITDPGADLKVTKVDVVPLQIEAAANQALQTVGWYSTANGGPESRHDLPAPADPRYAVYQPTLYLDELNLSDWDVLTYYAKASTEKQSSYASEVYFLEVRPFREDILKTPGGENGQAYKALNELTSLIQRQQHVIRQTHQHVQHPPPQENVRAQDRKKISEAEDDLRDSAHHLYSQMAAEMENKPIGEALDNLAQAEKSLDQASESIQDNALTEGQNRERRALLQLVNARKMFQKSVSEHPDQFQEPKDEVSPPIAESARKLSQMAEFRDEAKAASEFVDKTLQEQKQLDQQARLPTHNYPQLAGQEKALEKGLTEFQQQHPKVFKGSEEDAQRASEAMMQAAQSLQGGSPNSPSAARQLQKLSEDLKTQSAARQLADAYKLKQMLDNQIQTLDQRAKAQDRVSDEDLRNTAGQARQTINQLKKTADEAPTRDAFGQPLRDALSGENKADLEAKLSRLEKPRRVDEAKDSAPPSQRAGEARDALQKVSSAFGQSEPKGLQMAQKSDSLKPGEQDGFSQGMTELASLIKQLEEKRPVAPNDQAKQARQAMVDLEQAVKAVPGSREQTDQVLLEIEKNLKPESGLDVAMLKQLMNQLQHFSAEVSDHLARKDDQPIVRNIDPAALPPAYRGRIQRYFQKLSEP